jgi:hypothetical protein
MLQNRFSRAKSQNGTNNSRKASRLHRKRGVSDIIGTILILAITVTLFSSIFFFVSSLPGPAKQSVSQFQATLGVSGGTENFVNVTYVSGPVLSGGGLNFYISSKATPGATTCHNPYSLSQGLIGATTWSAGQTWVLPLNSSILCPGYYPLSSSGDNVTITIVDATKNVLLLSVTLPGSQANIPPMFVSDGTVPSPVVGAGPFYVWAQIKDPRIISTSNVYANLTSLPSPVSGVGVPTSCSANPLTNCKVKMTYVANVGLWETVNLTTSSSALGKSFPVLISATDTSGLSNSAVLYARFSASQGASLTVVLSASPGNPTIHQNTTIVATLANSGPVGGLANVTFTVGSGSFCPSQTVCTQKWSYNTSVPIGAFQSGVRVTAFWNATGKLPIGDGPATITAMVSLPSLPITPLIVTVYPNTVLIDGTGVPQGISGDPFVYLTTDFVSANIPFTPLTAPPASQTITWGGTGATNLQNYNVIVWDMGNVSYPSAANSCMSTQDAQALSSAETNGRGVWLMGGDAFTCPSASNYLAQFGIKSYTANSPAAGNLLLHTNAISQAPVTGLPAAFYLGSTAVYSTLSLSAGATSYLCSATCSSTNNLALTYSPAGMGPAIATSFDLAALAAPSSGPFTSPIVTSTGTQASVAYNGFDWLAGFVNTKTVPPTNVNSGEDWAVSQVTVQPSAVSFQSRTFVDVTVRDNGNWSTTITAELLINGVPYPSSSSPLQVTLTPTALGGSLTGTILWQPATVGTVTVGAMIIPPTNDSNAGNNLMLSSLFNAPVYVSYSVLVVDDTLHSVKSSFPDNTNSTVIPALIAAGFNQTTINTTYINTGCGSVANILSNYNLVVWNSGTVTYVAGTYCPLTDTDANLLASFLVNGGKSSSLLYLGGGLMTVPTTDTAVNTFANTYLGTTLSGAQTPLYVSSVIGRTGDMVGNGMNIPYLISNTANTNYTCAPTGIGAGSLYYNVTSAPADYWTGQSYCAGTDTAGVTGWKSAYWAFSLINTQDSPRLNLAVLRAATFFGRILPNSDTIITTPDITFSVLSSPWTNFDNMHPQLQEQYLIRVNVTNLEGQTAQNLAVSLYDGSHILGTQTLNVGGSTYSSSGVTTLGIGQFSIPWTPLYAGKNQITAEITSSTAGQVLPGVAHRAAWNVTVYFFYDSTRSNTNAWTHNQLLLFQANVNPTTCDVPAPGSAMFYWDNHNVPQKWPVANGNCPTTSNYGADTWGMDAGTCYNTQWTCASLAVKDDITHSNSVQWTFTSPITIPTGSGNVSATWWQKFNMANYLNGGVICVTTDPASLVSGAGGSGSGVMKSLIGCDNNIPGPNPTNNQTTVTVYPQGGPCYLMPAFTGASAGGTGAWEQENLNLNAYVGKTVYVAFGYVESSSGCGTGTNLNAQTGWFVDNFRVYVSSSTPNPAFTSGTAVPQDVWGIYPSSALSTSLTAMSAGAPPTGSAWVSAGWDGGTTVLDPNMWDSLYSRPIDLTSAVDATLTFNYLLSNVWWVNGVNLNGAPIPPCYVFTQDPTQGLELEIAPANTANWVIAWSANSQSYPTNNPCTAYPTTVGYTPSNNVYGSGSASVTTWGWRTVPVSLQGYVGQVIQLRFITGTNNGGNVNGNTYVTPLTYPMLTTSNKPIASGAMISGIYVQGNTSISPGPGPLSMSAPQSSPVKAPSTTGISANTQDGSSLFRTPNFKDLATAASLQSLSGGESETVLQTQVMDLFHATNSPPLIMASRPEGE